MNCYRVWFTNGQSIMLSAKDPNIAKIRAIAVFRQEFEFERLKIDKIELIGEAPFAEGK